MGRINIGPGEVVLNVETQEVENLVEKSIFEPNNDNHEVLNKLELNLKELSEDLENHKINTYQIFDQNVDDYQVLNDKIQDLQSELNKLQIAPAAIKTYVNYDDKPLRALIQQLSEVVEQNYKGQDFVNARFRQDLNSLKNEKQPVTEIVRIHERLPKWVFYGFIFNFILALLGYLT